MSPNIAGLQSGAEQKPADGETLLWACDQRDARTLGPGLLNDARNLRYADGLPTTRKGVMKPAWANYVTALNLLIGSLGTPYGSGVFRDPDGSEWQMVAAGGYVWRTRPGNANVTVQLPTGINIAGPCNFVQAFNVLFLFRGRYLAPLVLTDLNTGFTDLLPQYDPAHTYNATVVATGQAADQMAYGPYQAVTSLTWANGVATCVTTLPHGYITGSDVTVRGATQIEFNGRKGITVTDIYTFTYALTATLVATATGTITVSNNAYYWTALGSSVPVSALVRGVSASFTLTSLVSLGSFTVSSLTSPRTFAGSLTCAGTTTVTVTIANHGLVNGQSVVVTGAGNPFNGTWTIGSVTTNTFTYTLAGPGPNVTLNCNVAATYSTLATAVATAHGLTGGQTVTISGTTGAGAASYNGTFVVTVVDANTFTYTMASNPNAAAGGTITCTPANNTTAVATRAGHGLTTGNSVTISGATPSAYNGTYTITVTSSSQFTYTFAGSTSAAGGTITATVYAATSAVATASLHKFVTGDFVTITGASLAPYNGTFPITVTDANTFTYVMASDPGASAAGSITATTSRVLPGQNPDVTPAAWTRTYNILPNADTALFVNGLLLVPTAYQPSSVDNYATFNGGSYSKVDYLVATNYLDYVHFSFANVFRINQGGADEIVDLFKFGPGSVIVLKGKSWAVLGNVQGNLSQITLDIRSTEYGCAGPRAWTVVGSIAYFLSPRYGIVVIRQSDLGILLSVNVPLSAPIQKTIDLIDWNQAAKCRMSHWDNKLYLSAPLKTVGPAILVYDFKASVRLGNNVWESGVMTQGWTPLDTGSALNVVEFHRMNLNGEERHFFLDAAGYVNLMEENDGPDQVVNASGPQGLGWEEIQSYALSRAYHPSLTGQERPTEECLSLATQRPNYTVRLIFPDANHAVTLVANKTRSNTAYDRPFTALPWDPTNSNDDWAKPWRQDYSVTLGAPAPGTPNLAAGLLLNLAVAGYAGAAVNGFVVGKSYRYTPGSYTDGTDFLSAGYHPPIPISTGGGFTALQTSYYLLAPPGDFGKAALAAIQLLSPLNPGSGLALDQFQETLDTRRIAGKQGKSFQLEFTNTQGRIKLVGQRISSVPGRNRRGVLI